MKNVELKMKETIGRGRRRVNLNRFALFFLPPLQSKYFSIYSWLASKLDTNLKELPYEASKNLASFGR